LQLKCQTKARHDGWESAEMERMDDDSNALSSNLVSKVECVDAARQEVGFLFDCRPAQFLGIQLLLT
jgi:hypothetical protein